MEKEQKVVITDAANVINSYLDKGWTVSSVTAQYVATANTFTTKGEFCFVLERLINK